MQGAGRGVAPRGGSCTYFRDCFRENGLMGRWGKMGRANFSATQGIRGRAYRRIFMLTAAVGAFAWALRRRYCDGIRQGADSPRFPVVRWSRYTCVSYGPDTGTLQMVHVSDTKRPVADTRSVARSYLVSRLHWLKIRALCYYEIRSRARRTSSVRLAGPWFPAQPDLLAGGGVRG